MYYDGTQDPQEDSIELFDKILYREYETQDHYVFSVYRGNRNWKRLSRRRRPKTTIWIECRVTGPDSPAIESDIVWLNYVWDNPGKYSKVQRFPRDAGQFSWDKLPRFDPNQVPKAKWIIDLFLAERSIQLVFGERGSFKSTLLLFASRAVAAKEEVLGMKTLRRRVVYLDYENPSSAIKTRSTDLALNLPDNPSLVIWDRFGSHPLPKPGDPSLELLVRSCVAETGHGPWLIFDSWASLLKPGEGGEFTAQIAPIYLPLRRLADLGATVTVIDHSRKYNKTTLYGGQDKEAKVDSIHNLTVFPDKTRPEKKIIQVDSWLKRYAPQGVGNFAFEVQSKQGREGNWHIVDLVLAQDPEKAQLPEQIELLRDLISHNPNSGQEALATLAAQRGLPRDQAIGLLKDGTGKHWQIHRAGHNKYTFSLIK
jgi:AAA domain